MRKFYLLLLLALWSGFAKAQITITGKVTAAGESKGLPAVSVTVKEKSASGMLAFALTDEKGSYHLSFKSTADSVVLTVSGLNFKKQTVTAVNKSQNLNFEVTTAAIKLKEIKVTPPKIRKLNDTLDYLVEGFTDKNDRTIGDVLKKMPGITVKDDGGILYNNKPINKFYIEGKDLLQGRYGIATNNIAAKDVATVQVMENHQPIKALKDWEFTDEGALNLKLKDSAKGVLVANGQVGAGASPFLWNNELFSMFFKKGRQNMNTYKGNNTGDDAAAEMNAFYGGGPAEKSASSLYVQSPASPGISRKRYLFNRANAVSVNNLWAYGKDYQLNANVSYLNDRQQKDSYSRSVYYLPSDSVINIEEQLAATEHINALDGTVDLNANNDKYYLNNSFKFTGKWNNEVGNVLNTENTLQRLNKPFFKGQNTFDMVKKYARSMFKLYSYNAYSSTPQTLDVSPMRYPELFEPDTYDMLRQSLKLNQFNSMNSLTYGLGKDNFKQSYVLGFDASLQQFETNLNALSALNASPVTTDSLSNDLQWNRYEVYVRPDYTYTDQGLRMVLSLPLNYNNLYSADRITAESKSRNKVFFNPSFTLRYELNLFWNVSAGARYNNTLGGLENTFTGYIMQSYRSLIRNEGELPEQKSQAYNVDFSYRHPIHAVFLNFGAKYTHNAMNLLYGYDYQGILNIKNTYQIPNKSDSYSFSGGINKGVDAIGGKVTLNVSYNSSTASQISQGQVVQFTSERYEIEPGFTTKINKWASASYTFQYAASKNKVANAESNFKTIVLRTQRAQVNLFPVSGVTINMALENFYNNVIVSGSRSQTFADIGAKYKLKKLEFNLAYNNIFDIRQYVAASYNEISTFYSTYNLRPAQVLLKVRFSIK